MTSKTSARRGPARLRRLAVAICATAGVVAVALPATTAEAATPAGRHHHGPSFAGGVWGGYVA
ncbi:hypothetical protein, partial [Streptacidiphilus neutrinimicus]|uniref:hypothetical protein n=1 Tax=Streptacidiphilus neutrinimicus TaxID=105420 RepID=UPI0005A715B7